MNRIDDEGEDDAAVGQRRAKVDDGFVEARC
jgi:hypothetical protein